MGNKSWAEKIGFNRPWPKPSELSRRRKWRRTYAVLCYCSPAGPEKENPFVGGKRLWRLLDIKQFKLLSLVEASHSFERLYAPFNHVNHLVVVARSIEFVEYLTEYQINDEKPYG